MFLRYGGNGEGNADSESLDYIRDAFPFLLKTPPDVQELVKLNQDLGPAQAEMVVIYEWFFALRTPAPGIHFATSPVAPEITHCGC